MCVHAIFYFQYSFTSTSFSLAPLFLFVTFHSLFLNFSPLFSLHLAQNDISRFVGAIVAEGEEEEKEEEEY